MTETRSRHDFCPDENGRCQTGGDEAECPAFNERDTLRDALQTLLDAVEGNRVTVGDCIQARKALGAV
jgi:hypothetical protein